MSGLGPVERHRAADRFVFSVIIVATISEAHVAAPVEKAVDIRENADLHILPYQRCFLVIRDTAVAVDRKGNIIRLRFQAGSDGMATGQLCSVSVQSAPIRLHDLRLRGHCRCAFAAGQHNMRRQIEPLRRDGALPAARRDGQRGMFPGFTPLVKPQIACAVQRWGVRAAGDGVVAIQGDGHSHQIRIRQIDRAAMIAVQPQLDAAVQALQLPAISREKCLILCKLIRFAVDHSRAEILILRIEPQLHGIRRDVHLPAAICRPRHRRRGGRRW